MTVHTINEAATALIERGDWDTALDTAYNVRLGRGGESGIKYMEKGDKIAAFFRDCAFFAAGAGEQKDAGAFFAAAKALIGGKAAEIEEALNFFGTYAEKKESSIVLDDAEGAAPPALIDAWERATRRRWQCADGNKTYYR